MQQIVIEDIDQLDEVADAVIRELLPDRNILCFFGPMGAGKTTLISEICRKLGVEDSVTSPTFALINEYHSPDQQLFHFDFYRINSLAEAYDLGYEEYFYGNSVCLIEWPEKIEELLPEHYGRISIEIIDADTRRFTLERL